jgi:hypothetical protein
MKKTTKSILGAIAGILVLLVTTTFIVSDPQADFTKQNLSLNDQISLSEIPSKNLVMGVFKSSVKFTQKNFNNPAKEFYGQEIVIADNPQVDKILIGVTNNLISRVEIWNQNNLIDTKELGFMNKMTWGETQTMTIDFYDQTNEKYKGKSRISMHFHNGTGFLGDIGTINFDLTGYGDLSGDKSIGVFAKSIKSQNSTNASFADLQIWKNYKSFD